MTKNLKTTNKLATSLDDSIIYNNAHKIYDIALSNEKCNYYNGLLENYLRLGLQVVAILDKKAPYPCFSITDIAFAVSIGCSFMNGCINENQCGSIGTDNLLSNINSEHDVYFGKGDMIMVDVGNGVYFDAKVSDLLVCLHFVQLEENGVGKEITCKTVKKTLENLLVVKLRELNYNGC